jgi:hypothetical protein
MVGLAFLTAGFRAWSADCASPPARLVSWWPGEGTANDIAGTNNGTLVNGVTFAPGEVGQAFSFNGTSSYVRVADNPNLRFTKALTIEAWIYPTSVGGYYNIVCKWDYAVVNAQKSYVTGLLPDGRIGLGICADGDCMVVTGANSTNLVPVNQWTHFAGTYDGSNIRMYVNGVCESQTPCNYSAFPGTGDLLIGAASAGGGQVISPFAGLIDEPSVYNRALSAAEIQAIYNAGSAGKCPVPFITSQPQGQTATPGSTVTFMVTAGGAPPLSYQWQFNSTNIAGATANSLTLTNVQPGQAGNYLVVVSNALGAVTSSNAVLAVFSPTCATPPAGLVGWWPGEGNANDIADTNNGILSGGASFASGEVGQAFSFDGTNGTVTVPDSSSLRLTNQLTIEFWVKRQQVTSPEYLLNKGGDWTRGALNFGVAIAAPEYNNMLQFLFAGGNRGAGSVHDLSWHHCAIVARNGDVDPTFYLDGVPQPVTDRQGASTIQLYPSTEPLHIGAQLDPAWNYYAKTTIDEMSLYSRALSASEIAAIYNAGSAGKCVPPPNCIPPPSGLVSWWPGEGSADDIIGTNNGTLVGGASFVSGEVGQAFSFNGANQCVQIPYAPSLVSSNYSVEAWVKPLAQVSDPINQDVIFGQSYGQCQLAARRGSTGVRIAFQFGVSQVTFYGVVSTNEIPIGQFTHLTGTWDGTTLRLYINGVLNAQRTPGASPVDPGCPFSIGGIYNTAVGGCNYVGQFFNGLIDEVSYYNRALSGGEVQAIYLADGAGKCKPTPTPHAATATATVVSDFVVGATITDGGWGYTNTPIVRIFGGGGSGAQAVAVVSNGVVVAVNVMDAGSGYTNTPVIVIAPPFIPQPTMGIAVMSLLSFSNLAVGTNYQLQFFSGNTWSNLGAAFAAASSTFTQYVSGTAGPNGYRLASTPVPTQAAATAQVVNGFVVGATVTSGGSGYSNYVMVSIVGGGGSNATAIATVSSGVVTGLTITDAGIGYTTTPSILIAPPPVNALWPMVTQAMELDLGSLSPYDNYQLEFAPVLGGAWSNLGGLFNPTATTSTQYVNVSGNAGFFRVRYVP